MRALLLAQLDDAAFPSGGFAHSNGLEALAAQRLVDGASLPSMLVPALWAIGSSALPYVRAATRSRDRWPELDAHCEARIGSHVARRASRTQGRALLDTAARIWPTELAAARERLRTPHLAVAHGALFASLGLDAADAAGSFMHQSARGYLSAAVRLGLVGPHRAQRLQFEAAPVIAAILDRFADAAVDEAHSTSPLLELASANHDRLYARLFQS
jgi:urease accessory protein